MMTTTQTGGPGTGAGPQGAPAIELAGLHKSFGRARRPQDEPSTTGADGVVHAVKGLDLTVQPGEVVAFLGPNGAGKTSTIDMMLGLSTPDAGTARVFGMQPRAAVARGLVAAVMQTGGLLRDLTVRETVDLTASLFVQTRSVGECLQRAGIDDIADRTVHKCSGGQQQRLRFAMALVSDPALIVLDEPTTGMDVTGRRDFWSAIRQDAERGRTVLFATHYLEEADLYADRIVLMRQGQIVADGTGPQIKAMASGRTVRATLGGRSDQELAAIPGVESVEVRGESVLLHAKDSDSVARYLLTQTDARDVEITARGLEDAFVALTGDEH